MPSPVEKYELILAADPRSRIFVELGRALVEQGDQARAVEVLRAGLVHHTDSAMARVLLGRALIALDRHGEALEPLTQALALNPGDTKARQLLDLARERAPEPPPEVVPPAAEAAPVPAPAAAPPADPAPEGAAEFPSAGGRPPPVPPRLERQVPAAPRMAAPPLPPPPAAPAAPASPTALDHLPEPVRPPPPAANVTGLAIDPAEALRIAAAYERELREKAAAEAPPPKQSRGPALLVVVLLGLAVASAVTFLLVRRSYRAEEARAAVTAARAGLARDTLGSLREASRALDDALALDPAVPEATSLQAQATALLWTDFADDKALDRARALSASPAAGEGALVARYLTAPGAPERGRAAEALLEASSGGGPLLRVLAAGILRGRGDRDGARRQLETAAQATPPMLRALADLGDLLRADGDADEALRFYRIALRAHATHPRSVLGAADVALTQGKGLEDSLREVEALEADTSSRPPGPDQLRLLLSKSRLLFALSRADQAAAALDQAAGRFPGRPEVAAAQAEVEMARGAYDRAEAAAERAALTAPGDPAMRELLARTRLGRGRTRELLRDTEGTSSRPLRLLRAQARVEQGEWEKARAELEGTRRDGRVPAEAAAWLALCDVATGRTAQASAILQSLEPSRGQLPAALVAEGKLAAAGKKPAQAEQALRAAAAAEGAPPLARVELAAFLSGEGRGGEAREVLDAAVARNPFHAGARLARARLELAAGDREAAAADARRVVEDRPADAEAQKLLAEAEGRPAPKAEKAKAPGKKKPAKKAKKPARRK